MLDEQITTILSNAAPHGWIMEPDAKKLLKHYGIEMPPFEWVKRQEEVRGAADRLGFPLAAKVVSPEVIHKSDVGGVVVGIESVETLEAAFQRFSNIEGFAGMHVEPMAKGVELIVGMVSDRQFGPVVLLGIGGTTVEIYQDTAVRLAPITELDVMAMVKHLKGRALIDGYRGKPPISMDRLFDLMVRFSKMVMDLEDWIASIDLNPVMASPDACVIADARIMLKTKG
jgi:acetate---CoA ligase (ADP-forming) subunit beta